MLNDNPTTLRAWTDFLAEQPVATAGAAAHYLAEYHSAERALPLAQRFLWIAVRRRLMAQEGIGS